MLPDTEIRDLIQSGILKEADASRVGPVSYDLRNYKFYRDEKELDDISLEPGDSVFVGAIETLALPKDLVAQVGLKNSRIRQGLTLDAPVYFPGHSTRVFFRVTNVSADEITLEAGHEIAQVFFTRMQSPVETGYSGAFADEFSFAGVANYKDVYGAETRKIQRETEKFENVEQRIYGNVVAIMGVFIALFTMVSVNMSWATNNPGSIVPLVILNLSLVGGMSAMVGLISAVLGSKRSSKLPWIVSVVAFVASFALMAFCHVNP